MIGDAPLLQYAYPPDSTTNNLFCSVVVTPAYTPTYAAFGPSQLDPRHVQASTIIPPVSEHMIFTSREELLL